MIFQKAPPREPSPYMTADELADRWRVSGPFVRRQMRAGKIPHIQIGNRYRIRRSNVEEIEQCRAKPSDSPKTPEPVCSEAAGARHGEIMPGFSDEQWRQRTLQAAWRVSSGSPNCSPRKSGQ